jgi:methylenetetrahydrofolate reductase (NADPH)
MSTQLQRSLEAGRFAVTAELAPPKGFDFSKVLKTAEGLVGRLDAANVTDFQSASVKATSLALSIELNRLGLEPVLQMTGRDRNRIAIQGELLSAAHFGIQNLLSITGDYTTAGDNPQAKPVFELDSVSILQTATALMQGADLGGNALDDVPEYYLGAAVSPVYDPVEVQLLKMRKKILAGARFFQTQGVFDLDVMRRFKEQTADMDCKILAGIVPLKSPGMARFMNRNIPGIDVPQNLIDHLSQSADPTAEGIAYAGDFIARLKDEGLCDGVHIMAIGAEDNIAKIMDRAGL